MIAIFLATYGAVFLAEIVGDKLLYTTGILATRYRTIPIMIGMALAFMAKMAVAVAVGQAIARLPRPLVAAITALSFLGIAYTLWRKPEKTGENKKDEPAAATDRGGGLLLHREGTQRVLRWNLRIRPAGSTRNHVRSGMSMSVTQVLRARPRARPLGNFAEHAGGG